MITVFQHPTNKNITLGFSYYFFDDMTIHTDYQKFEHISQAHSYLESTKHYILSANIEKFRCYCEEIYPAGTIGRLQTIEDSIRIMHELTLLIIDNQERYFFCLENIIEKANFMRILVSNAQIQYRPLMIMMAFSIVDFCKTELAEYERKKIKG